MTRIVHIAGHHVVVDGTLRQRCAWCGALLMELHLPSLTIPRKPDGSPGDPIATWPQASLVAVDSGASVLVKAQQGQLPEDACAYATEGELASGEIVH